MKRFKIAVCLSAQARTWRTASASCLDYFNLPEHDVKFFGHTWDLNTWRKNNRSPYENEYLDIDNLRKELMHAYGFSHLHVDRFDDLSKILSEARHDEISTPVNYAEMNSLEFGMSLSRPVGWTPMMYSAMVSNHLKQKYEIENNITFDIVVKTRFDLCHEPGTNFSHQLFKISNQNTSKTLFCNSRSFNYEWGLSAIDDTFYYGTSDVMDIVDSFYNSYINTAFWKMIGCNLTDPAFRVVGPNVLLHKWCETKNIMMHDVGPFGFPVVRREVDNGAWIEDFEKIKKAWLGFHV